MRAAAWYFLHAKNAFGYAGRLGSAISIWEMEQASTG